MSRGRLASKDENPTSAPSRRRTPIHSKKRDSKGHGPVAGCGAEPHEPNFHGRTACPTNRTELFSSVSTPACGRQSNRRKTNKNKEFQRATPFGGVWGRAPQGEFGDSSDSLPYAREFPCGHGMPCPTPPSTVNRQPSTVNRQPSSVNRQPSTVNRQPFAPCPLR